MTMPQILILGILVLTLVLFIWGKWRFDVVSAAALVCTVLLGLINPDEAFSGFGHPATITVALILIISHTLTRSGAIEGLSKFVSDSVSSVSMHVALLCILAAVLSMFMNNVGALALLMPMAINSARRSQHSPAVVLMPIAFASMLGGLVTLIGTPPNIIIATYRQQATGAPFSMFDFTPVGGTVALIGVIFIAFIGWRLLRVREGGKSADEELFEIDSYVSEVKVKEDSKILEKTIQEIDEMAKDLDVLIVSLIHKGVKQHIYRRNQVVSKNDILLIEGSHEEIDKFITKFKLDIVTEGGKKAEMLHSKEADVFEVVVTPGSSLEGRSVEQARFRRKHNVNIIAISRQGKPYRGRLGSLRFKIGDVLLLYGHPDSVAEAISASNCLPLAERGLGLGRRKYAFISLGIFATAIAAVAFGLLPIQIALTGAILCMLISGATPSRELYAGIDWPVIVLLGAMIQIGNALETTGTTQLLVSSILSITEGTSVIFILGLILVSTMTLSAVLNNAATAILMAPIAKIVAEQLGSNPDAFLMTVAVGASCAFLTPIGHQNNALVMGPGGYKFGDYWRMGLPLEILIVAVTLPAIAYFWPL